MCSRTAAPVDRGRLRCGRGGHGCSRGRGRGGRRARPGAARRARRRREGRGRGVGIGRCMLFSSGGGRPRRGRAGPSMKPDPTAPGVRRPQGAVAPPFAPPADTATRKRTMSARSRGPSRARTAISSTSSGHSPGGWAPAGPGCGSRSSASRRGSGRAGGPRASSPATAGPGGGVLRRGMAQGGGARRGGAEPRGEGHGREASLGRARQNSSPKRTRTSTRSCSTRSRWPSLAPARAPDLRQDGRRDPPALPRVGHRRAEEEGRASGLSPAGRRCGSAARARR